ncbi:Hypothetical predicted protein [Octopus vulgaris]|uniref:Uncharacterized protein n=1 Tax=Octopus vulgaris TaxID=6645 RepID=A0AA36BD20_OCTVU|nr:Hypothetical predicted protein [Octopus vulgaris]
MSQSKNSKRTGCLEVNTFHKNSSRGYSIHVVVISSIRKDKHPFPCKNTTVFSKWTDKRTSQENLKL